MEYLFKAEDEEKGRRLDLFLAARLSQEYSRSFIQKIIAGKKAAVNNLPVKASHKVISGDEIRISIPEKIAVSISAEDIPLNIIFEDNDILVVNKPANLVVHPAAGSPRSTLVNALLNYTKELSSVCAQRPGIVHRLDKETSGVMVVAKTNKAHLKLVKEFAARAVKKKYTAIVKGRVEFDEGVIDVPIGASIRDFRKKSVRFASDSKESLTRYKVIRRFKDSTLLELVPETGRTHQIRVHLAYLGHPVLGDAKYGRAGDFPRLALHAAQIEFQHPVTAEPVKFSAPLPEEFIKYS